MTERGETDRPPIPSPRYDALTPYATSTLVALAILYTCYLAADILIPLCAALLLKLVLAPVPRLARRRGIPAPITAAVVLASLTAAIAFGFYGLSAPASQWMARAPQIATVLQDRLRDLKEPVAEVQQASEQMEKVADVADQGADTPEVVIRSPGLLERLFGTLREIGLQLAFMLVLLFFLLASGDLFREKLVKVLPRLRDKKRALSFIREIENDVSVYLLTITAINICLGLAIGLAMYAIGMPNPALWGLAAGCLNFVPYLGALVGIAIVSIVALITFDSLPQAAMAPLIYAGINIVEAQIITPSVLSSRLMLNPVIVFLSVGFWGWLWGVPGALMAVPLLVLLKAVCGHVDRLAPFGELLGGRRT